MSIYDVDLPDERHLSNYLLTIIVHWKLIEQYEKYWLNQDRVWEILQSANATNFPILIGSKILSQLFYRKKHTKNIVERLIQIICGLIVWNIIIVRGQETNPRSLISDFIVFLNTEITTKFHNIFLHGIDADIIFPTSSYNVFKQQDVQRTFSPKNIAKPI